MARATKKNRITSPELLELLLPWNRALEDDFLGYLKSVDRADGTIKQYRSDLDIFHGYDPGGCRTGQISLSDYTEK